MGLMNARRDLDSTVGLLNACSRRTFHRVTVSLRCLSVESGVLDKVVDDLVHILDVVGFRFAVRTTVQ